MSNSRLDLYLQEGVGDTYVNTEEESELLNKFVTLFSLAKSAKDNDSNANEAMVEKCRKAYLGTLNALTQDGKESQRPMRQLRRMCYELVESEIDNSTPMPRMVARYKTDLPLVNITENYLKYEVDNILSKYVNDKIERSTYVDGTAWYKVGWNSFNRTHNRSGDVRIEMRTIDQIVPQPGIVDYKKLEYIFEIQNMSITNIYDLYGRIILPTDRTTNVVKVVSCYYLNEERIVGLFMWAEASRQVICNEKSWQIRKLRTCTKCGQVVPQALECPVCGGKHFRYKNAETEELKEDLIKVYNPYEDGESDNPEDNMGAEVFAKAGTEVPCYILRQLPFVPRPAVSAVNSIYGISTVRMTLDDQDAVNKVLTKSVNKILKSGMIITKPKKSKISDTDAEVKIVDVNSTEEAQQFQAKQFVADTNNEIVMSNLLYDNGKATAGITDSFQGIKDTTATSGKAKEFAAAQSAGRIESMRVMKAAAFSGVYELVLKYLLAFSDEDRTFVRVLPDGTKKEETWNKYMFLDKDEFGKLYYRDDFNFNSDPAATLSQNRVQMWQEAQAQFVQGAFGNPADPRTIKMFWNIMDGLQYPLANVALAGIEDNEQHLPFEVEQAIMQNPELYQQILAELTAGEEKRGGARPNSGPVGNGNTHAANVEKTNLKNRQANKEVPFSAQTAGGNV